MSGVVLDVLGEGGNNGEQGGEKGCPQHLPDKVASKEARQQERMKMPKASLIQISTCRCVQLLPASYWLALSSVL